MADSIKKTAQRFGVRKTQRPAKMNDLSPAATNKVKGGAVVKGTTSSHGCMACPHPGVMNPHTGSIGRA